MTVSYHWGFPARCVVLKGKPCPFSMSHRKTLIQTLCVSAASPLTLIAQNVGDADKLVSFWFISFPVSNAAFCQDAQMGTLNICFDAEHDDHDIPCCCMRLTRCAAVVSM